MTLGSAAAEVAAINRYPVKSMLGEQLQQAMVGANGVLGDRAYALVDTSDGKVASAKNPAKWRNLLAFHASFTEEPTGEGAPPPVLITTPDGRTIHSDDPDVDAILSDAVGRSVRLEAAVTAPPVLDEVWPEIEGLAPEGFMASTSIGANDAGETISEIPMAMFAPGTFFDLGPLHLLTTATLRQLAALEPTGTFDPRRYRPTVLVETGASGFVENDWVGTTVALGKEVAASVVLPTMRCVMTTLAQEDLPVDRATLRAIARHNRVPIEGFGTWACAGVYATVAAGGTIAVGDPVAPA